MKYQHLLKLMASFSFELQASKKEYLASLEEAIKFNYLDLEQVKIEFVNAMLDESFDWVAYALRFKLVYDSNVFAPPNYKFTKSNLVSYLNSGIWDWGYADESPTVAELKKLHKIFTDLEVEEDADIFSILNKKEFDEFNFGIKYQFKLKFGKMVYTRQDIIYYLQSLVWDYLFPDFYNPVEQKELSLQCNLILRNYAAQNGWMDMEEMLEQVRDLNSNVDLYRLSILDWDKDVQHRGHYRNPFTLGFKRVDPKPMA